MTIVLSLPSSLGESYARNVMWNVLFISLTTYERIALTHNTFTDGLLSC